MRTAIIMTVKGKTSRVAAAIAVRGVTSTRGALTCVAVTPSKADTSNVMFDALPLSNIDLKY